MVNRLDFSSITFEIFAEFSDTLERRSMKFDRCHFKNFIAINNKINTSKTYSACTNSGKYKQANCKPHLRLYMIIQNI